jgi:hypothetical protein
MRQETAPLGELRSITPRAGRRAALLCASALALAALHAAHAAPSAELDPGEVEAKFVFQLLNYVTWPEPALPGASSVVVGVLGDEAFAATLRKVVDGHEAQGRAVEVRSVADAAAPGVHLLFVRGGDPSGLRELARQHYGASVLTVADRFDFPSLGGDVGIELVSGRVSFSINRRKSVRGNLVISSKLLRLASEVK